MLSVLIVLHELGHYLAGKRLGFGIEEFSLGMGPVLFRKKGKETDFTLRAFLIGGACRFHGEDEGVSDEKSFNAQKAWKRFIVVAAGPLMNLLTALVLAAVILMAFGTTEVIDPNGPIQVSAIEPDGPAAQSSLELGDILTEINGQPFSDYEGFRTAFAAVRDNAVDLTVLRGATIERDEIVEGDLTRSVLKPFADGERVIVHVENIRSKSTGNNKLEIGLTIHYGEVDSARYNVLTAAVGAFPYCWNMTKQVFGSLIGLFTGKYSIREMSGLVGTVSVMSQTMESASKSGVSEVIYVILVLGALISVNFAVVNLLPFPALDGGRLVFIVIELLRGKPIDPEKEGVVHFIGMILLLLLIAFTLVSDILKLF